MRYWTIITLLGLSAGALACEEVYSECEPDRAPSDFPGDNDRGSQCQVVCDHLAEINCNLGCPYLPDGGLDAGVQTTEVDCWNGCVQSTATMAHPDVDEASVTRALRCYAGADTCRQVGACSRLCGEDGAEVWPSPILCVESPM